MNDVDRVKEIGAKRALFEAVGNALWQVHTQAEDARRTQNGEYINMREKLRAMRGLLDTAEMYYDGLEKMSAPR